MKNTFHDRLLYFHASLKKKIANKLLKVTILSALQKKKKKKKNVANSIKDKIEIFEIYAIYQISQSKQKSIFAFPIFIHSFHSLYQNRLLVVVVDF